MNSISVQVMLDGKERRIEVLRTVKGLDAKDLEDTINLTVGGMTVHVLAPQRILKAKICNTVTIDQGTRNDVKHVKMMIPCLREFICDYAEGVKSSNEGRPLVNMLRKINEILAHPYAKQATVKWGIDFSKVWPMKTLQSVDHLSVVNFLKHQLN